MANCTDKSCDKLARDIFCDFLTIAIHGLLHSRQVYPAGVFKLRRKFNLPVHVCYHPDVFSYITQLVDSVADILKNRKLHAVHFITGATESDWERVTIKLHAFGSVTHSQLPDLEDSLKNCLLKLSIIETYLPSRTAGDVTWRVEIDAEDAEMNCNHASDWMRTDQTNQSEKRASNVGKLIPLKTSVTEYMKLEIVAAKLI